MGAARELMKMIKAERYFGNPPKLTPQWIAENCPRFQRTAAIRFIFSRRLCLGPFAEQFIDAA